MTFAATILTLYPEMFLGPLGVSLAGKALERGDWSCETVQIREFATVKHRAVDDTPAGGGAGMVLKSDVLGRALDHVIETHETRSSRAQSRDGRSEPGQRVSTSLGPNAGFAHAGMTRCRVPITQAGEDEKTLFAELDTTEVEEGLASLDTDGHYSRPDVFELRVDTRARNGVEWND
jgi:hypothetical protein